MDGYICVRIVGIRKAKRKKSARHLLWPYYADHLNVTNFIVSTFDFILRFSVSVFVCVEHFKWIYQAQYVPKKLFFDWVVSDVEWVLLDGVSNSSGLHVQDDTNELIYMHTNKQTLNQSSPYIMSEVSQKRWNLHGMWKEWELHTASHANLFTETINIFRLCFNVKFNEHRTRIMNLSIK